MFLLWRERTAHKRVRPGPAGGRVRCLPYLEALEDRFVLSSAASTPPLISPPASVDQLLGVAVTAYADTPFSGVVATFTGPTMAGLTSAIDWPDGHVSVGMVSGSNGSNSFGISGASTFPQAGSFTILVSVSAGTGILAEVQTTVTVLAPPIRQTPSMPLNGNAVDAAFSSSADALLGFTSVSTVLAGTSSTIVLVVPASIPAPPLPPANSGTANYVTISGVQIGPTQLFRTQVSPPVRIVVTDFVSWSSLREQGLNQPTVTAAPVMSSEHMSWTNLSAQIAAAAAQNSIAAGADIQLTVKGISALEIVIAVVPVSPTGAPDRADFAAGVPSQVEPSQSLMPGQREAGFEGIYHQPLHRLTERSELSGPVQVAAAFEADDDHAVVLFDRRREQAQDLEISDRTAKTDRSLLSAGSLLETAAVWAIVQALQSNEFPRSAARSPTLEKAKALPTPPMEPTA